MKKGHSENSQGPAKEVPGKCPLFLPASGNEHLLQLTVENMMKSPVRLFKDKYAPSD